MTTGLLPGPLFVSSRCGGKFPGLNSFELAGSGRPGVVQGTALAPAISVKTRPQQAVREVSKSAPIETLGHANVLILSPMPPPAVGFFYAGLDVA